jgi:hypothetical protein
MNNEKVILKVGRHLETQVLVYLDDATKIMEALSGAELVEYDYRTNMYRVGESVRYSITVPQPNEIAYPDSKEVVDKLHATIDDLNGKIYALMDKLEAAKKASNETEA